MKWPLKHEVHLHLYHVSRLSNVIVYIFIISGVAYILTNEGKITDLSVIQVSGHNFLMELQRDAGNYTNGNVSVCLRVFDATFNNISVISP